MNRKEREVLRDSLLEELLVEIKQLKQLIEEKGGKEDEKQGSESPKKSNGLQDKPKRKG